MFYMAKRRGRPSGSTGKARSELLQIRVDALEKEAFEEAARFAGLTASGWARARLRTICRKELEQQGRSVPFLPSGGTADVP
jgi:hypothetical protein